MAVKLVFLLPFLIVQVSCGQSSLTFVIDDTASMGSDIGQVKKVAKSIVDIVLLEKSSQIKDIVLVTFNDPGSELRIQTRNAEELKQALDSISVHGGGDCPEEALAGIKKGLEASAPGSYVFVFTDASAKDYSKFAEIKTLCQEKQSQIIFVLTGHCHGIDHEGNQVYHKIAAASNGQVFRIGKNEVGEVLEYVKETIKGDRTVIASRIVPANKWNYINFDIDEQTEYAVVSASGSDVELSVTEQRSSNLIHGTQITWSRNVKVLKLQNLTPGTYTARVRGNSEINIMVFARTDFTFLHGFSSEVKTNLKDTDTQPTTGIETHLMISVQDKKHSANIQEVELLNMNDVVVRTLPLTHVQGDLYRTDKFLSPAHTFKIAVVATSKRTGSTVKRVAKTPVTPIQSVKPTIENPSSIQTETENKTVTLECRVTGGYPKPTVNWYYKGHASTKYETISENNGPIRIQNVQLSDTGLYKCVAQNVAGQAERVVTLVVNVKPTIQNPSSIQTETENKTVTLECRVTGGYPKPTVNWYYKGHASTKYETISENNGPIRIQNVQLSDAGLYKCVATNVVGRAERVVTLVVKVKPTIQNPSSIQTETENKTVTLECRVTGGYPKPTVNWYYKGHASTKYETISENNGPIRIQNVQLSDAGLYKCVAANVVGRAERVVTLVVNAPPRIVFIPPNSAKYIGVEGDLAMRLTCLAVGHPTPTITWRVDNQVVTKDKSKQLYVDTNALVFLRPMAVHSTVNTSHMYVCEARNNFGKAVQPYEVDISKYPDLGDVNGTNYGHVEQPYNVHCPLPYTDPNSIRWYKNGLNINKIGPSLRFERPTHKDDGNYTCRVSNMDGAASYAVEIIFGTPPHKEQSYNVYWNGESKKISCYANEIPMGKYEWFLNEKKIEGVSTESLSIMSWGQLACHITHPLGNLVVNFKVESQNQECGISKSFLNAEHAPVILDSSKAWPTLSVFEQYVMMPHSEKLQLFCQTDSKSSNNFAKFPTLQSVYATCDKEESFTVNGVSQKISELHCKEEVKPSVVKTGKTCLGENSELMHVGFHINGFKDVYESCVDTIKNVPLYTKMNTLPVRKESSGTVKAVKKACVDKCCYEKMQLVNTLDVSFGPAEKATNMDSLNSVNYCKPKNNETTNWYDIEMTIRDRAERDYLTVWSGAVNYAKLGDVWTPKYLWKVINAADTSEKMVVVHENAEPAGAKLCAGACGEDVVWLEPAGHRTYCCDLADFKKAFNIAIDFNH